MVRAKFCLIAVTHALGGAKTLRFEPRYDMAIPEDQRFSKATPWGTIELHVDNPAAAAKFELGKSYYADFTPVPED